MSTLKWDNFKEGEEKNSSNQKCKRSFENLLCCCDCCPGDWAASHIGNWSWLDVVDDDDECISLLPFELLLLLLLLLLLKWKRGWSRRYCCCGCGCCGWKYWRDTFGGEGVAVTSKRWCFKESGDEVFDEQVDVGG